MTKYEFEIVAGGFVTENPPVSLANSEAKLIELPKESEESEVTE